MDLDLSNSSYNISEPHINLGISNKSFNFFMFIIIIIIFFIIIIPWNKIKNKNLEGMSGGTLTQLFANDSQDVNIKSNVDKLATGNFRMFWNEPTMITQSFQNRGTPLSTFILPDTSMNPNPYALEVSNSYTDNILNKRAKKVYPKLDLKSNSEYKFNPEPNPNYLSNKTIPISQNLLYKNSVPTIPQNILPSTVTPPLNPNKPPNPYELSFVGEQIAVTEEQKNNLPAITKWNGVDYLYQGLYNDLLYNKDCLKDVNSCGNGMGGSRLGEDFVEPTKTHNSINISGNTFYPDSYVGSYFRPPLFDIVKPYPFIPNKNIV